MALETALHTVDGLLYASITYFMLDYAAFTKPANRAWDGGLFCVCIMMMTDVEAVDQPQEESLIAICPLPPQKHTTTAAAHFLIYAGVIIIQSIMGSILVQVCRVRARRVGFGFRARND